MPKSTLGDRISGRVTHGTLSGPSRYLSREEEDELVRFLLGCVSVGYAKSRKEVLALVQSLVANLGITKLVTSGWWESFCRRNPNLTIRVTQHHSHKQEWLHQTVMLFQGILTFWSNL